jgi:hypothetical protein
VISRHRRAASFAASATLVNFHAFSVQYRYVTASDVEEIARHSEKALYADV